ncbi:MAG: NADH-quinone oxidoreductase subunit B family protein, partial [Candidatus Helarchaeales archaeon]
MKVGIFQFNGCEKCFNETLYKCCAVEGSQINDVVRVSDPKTWQGDALDAAVITGYLTAEDEPTLKKISDHAKKMVAYGSCATTGGIFGLSYQKGNEIMPLHNFYPKAVDVNGCLGEVEELSEAIKGQSFSKTRALCKVCARKSDCDYVEEVQRVIDVEENPEVCYNDQGLMCMGFIAIECKEACVNYGTPCRGCKPMVDRPGFRMMGMWGTLLGNIEVATEATGKGGTDKLADEDDEVTEANPDVVGQFFRFGLADSIMPVGRQTSTGNIYSDIFVGR